MLRRLLPLLIPLALGLGGLAWGLASLQRLFARERDDALAGIEERRRTLAQYASASLAEALHRDLADREPHAAGTARAPSAPPDGLILLGPGHPVPGELTSTSSGPLHVPRMPALVQGRWYFEPRGDDMALGARIELAAHLAAVDQEMLGRGLLGADERLALPASVPESTSPEALAIRVESRRWAIRRAHLQRRYQLETALLVGCGALALGLVAFALLAHLRKQRFLQLRSDFVATVSHELRTPLASIRLLAETIERRLPPAEAGDYPSRIVREADGLHLLVENLLSFNRIDKGRWVPRLAPVRLEELLAGLRDELPTYATEPVQLETDVGELELHGDAQLLRLLLANLARNGCLYNRRSPVVLRVRAEGRRVLFSDNGVGLDAREWDRVFGEFYRPAERRVERPGSGLGLALVQRIMHLHGGRARVAASGPDGTTFALDFPEPPRE